jgi:hypothetical protein
MNTDTIFWLQVGRPRVLIGGHEPAQDFAGALQAIFPMETEDAYLNWNHAFICLSYKYDLSVAIDSLVPLLWSLVKKPSGFEVASFNSDTFHTEWEVTWSMDRLAIEAKWHQVAGDLDCVRRRCSRMEIGRLSFLAEWKALLRVLLDSTSKSKIFVENDSDRKIIRRIISRIHADGRLYQKPSLKNSPPLSNGPIEQSDDNPAHYRHGL